MDPQVMVFRNYFRYYNHIILLYHNIILYIGILFIQFMSIEAVV